MQRLPVDWGKAAESAETTTFDVISATYWSQFKLLNYNQSNNGSEGAETWVTILPAV